MALLLAAAACGRVDFEPVSDGSETQPALHCDWSAGVPTHGASLHRTELSNGPNGEYEDDPILARDDPHRIYFGRFVASGEESQWTAYRTTLEGPFDEPERVTGFVKDGFGGEALFVAGDGITSFATLSEVALPTSDYDLYELLRESATSFARSRRLDELDTAEPEYDPWLTRNGTEIWFTRSVGGVGQVWRARRSSIPGSPWLSPAPVPGFPDQSSSATLTDDGLTVFITVQPGVGDIYYATRASELDEFGSLSRLLLSTDGAVPQYEPIIRGDGCELFYIVATGMTGTEWEPYSVSFTP
ncbi:hypothetical protein BH11MYX2_BH11MYX2_35060 [soil metagenome]